MVDIEITEGSLPKLLIVLPTVKLNEIRTPTQSEPRSTFGGVQGYRRLVRQDSIVRRYAPRTKKRLVLKLAFVGIVCVFRHAASEGRSLTHNAPLWEEGVGRK